jgi:hypothetical protein
MDGTGEVSGWLGRLRRAFEFTLMDRLVDFAVYERALRDGRAVVMVTSTVTRRGRGPSDPKRHGGHFINYYGGSRPRARHGADPSRRSKHRAADPPASRGRAQQGGRVGQRVTPTRTRSAWCPTSTVPTSPPAEARPRLVAALMRPSGRRAHGESDPRQTMSAVTPLRPCRCRSRVGCRARWRLRSGDVCVRWIQRSRWTRSQAGRRPVDVGHDERRTRRHRTRRRLEGCAVSKPGVLDAVDADGRRRRTDSASGRGS